MTGSSGRPLQEAVLRNEVRTLRYQIEKLSIDIAHLTKIVTRLSQNPVEPPIVQGDTDHVRTRILENSAE